MKTSCKFLAATAVLLGLAACSKVSEMEDPEYKVQENLVPVTLGADFEGTKTTMASNGDILWLAGDQISVQVGSNNYTFTLDSGENTTSGTFSALVTESDAAIIAGTATGTVSACYPKSSAEVPTSQTWAEGTFADETFPMTASYDSPIANPSLGFTTNAAVVRVQGVSKDATSAVLSYTVSETPYSVTMSLTAGETAKDLYFVVVPGAQKFNLALNGGAAVEYTATAATEAGSRYNLTVSGVAKIGEITYPTLAAAFAAATDGQTIELLQDCSFSSTISIDKEIALDLKSKDINVKAYGTGFSIEDGGDLTVTGGSFSQGAPWSDGCGDDYNYFLFETKSGSQLTLNNVTTSGYNTHDGAIVRMRGNADVTLYNLDITTDNVIVNSAGSTVQNTLIVDGGKYTTSKTDGPAFNFEYTTGDFNAQGTTSTTLNCHYGVKANTGADIDLTNVTATQCGNTCVYYCSDSKGVLTNCDFASSGHVVGVAGDVNRTVGGSQVTGDITINGGTYICHGSEYAVFKVYTSGGKITANSGTFTNDNSGDAAYYDSRNSGNVNVGTDTQPACVILNGGTLTGKIRAQHKAKLYVHGGTVNGNATLAGEGSPIEADGGTFSFDPETSTVSGTKDVKIADGYKAVDNGNNTWSIVVDSNVTNVNTGAGYSTLKEAVENASSGDVIRLDKDFTEANEVDVYDKDITLDLNSKTITFTNSTAFRVEHNSGTAYHASLILDDLSDGKTGKIICEGSKFIYFGSNSAGTAFTMNHGEIICNGNSSCTTLYCYYTGCDVTINGGKITNEKADYSGSPLLYLKSGTTATINGGELVATGSSYCEVVNIAGGTLNITGGTLKSISPSSQSYCINGGYYSGTINISGGTISAFSDYQSACTITSGSSNIINITGGELSADVNSTSNRQTIKNIDSASSSSSITGGTFKVGRTGSSYYGYKYDYSIKTYIPSTHQLNGPTTSEGSTLGEYTVTAK